MKKSIAIAALMIGALILYGIFGPPSIQKVDITTAAFMYTADGKISKTIATKLHGSLNKEGAFQGVLNIEAAEFPHVIFVSGTGLVSFQDKEREVFGPIYYDREHKQYAIAIDNPQTFERLTGEPYDEHPLVIVTSALDQEEAEKQYEALQKKVIDEWEAKQGQ